MASSDRRTLPARRDARLRVFLKRQSCLKNGFKTLRGKNPSLITTFARLKTRNTDIFYAQYNGGGPEKQGPFRGLA